MNLDKYINDLLFFYDLVIIPDFGGFVANYQAAKINKTNFEPAKKTVMFNSDLKNNDGLLLSSIINYEKISQEQAKAKIDNFVKTTKANLNSGKLVYLKNIGFLKKTKNNLIFEPDIKSNFLLDNFGLEKFNSPLIENQLQKTIQTQTNTNYIINNRRIKQLAVGIPLALLLTLIPYKSNLVKNLSSFNVFQTYSKIDKAIPYDSITINPKSIDKTVDKITSNKSALFFAENKKNITTNKNNKTVKKTKKLEKTTIKTTDTKNTLKKYQLISGSFKDKNNAQKRLKKLQKKGLNPILDKRKNRYRIIASSFDSKSQAKEKSKELKLKKISCWIYTAK